MDVQNLLKDYDLSYLFPGVTAELEPPSPLTAESTSFCSVASSRTGDTDYGLYYTRQALSMRSDDDWEEQNENSNTQTHEVGVTGPRLPENVVRRIMHRDRDDSLPRGAVQQQPQIHYLLEDGQSRIDHEYLKNLFRSNGRLTEVQALQIISIATDICTREPNMVPVRSPVTVCGGTHGQYSDLLKLLEIGGSLQDSVYVFLGDYVNVGCSGVECLLYLYALKICSPSRIVLLRGRHESRYLTESLTFKRECLDNYSEEVYEAFLRSFRSLPIAALIDERLFCVHGGISPELITLEDLNHTNRFKEPGSHGLLHDLLWSDPIASFGHKSESILLSPLVNSTLEYSRFYTCEAVCRFLDRNNLLTIIRGHEEHAAGFKVYHTDGSRRFPPVITIISASNNLEQEHHNSCAILTYANKNIVIMQYLSDTAGETARRIFMKRKRVIKCKILAIGRFSNLLRKLRYVKVEEEIDVASAAYSARRKHVIQHKILAVGRFSNLLRRLREPREAREAAEYSNQRMNIIRRKILAVARFSNLLQRLRKEDTATNPETSSRGNLGENSMHFPQGEADHLTRGWMLLDRVKA